MRRVLAVLALSIALVLVPALGAGAQGGTTDDGLRRDKITGPRYEDSSPGGLVGAPVALGAVAVMGVVVVLVVQSRRHQRQARQAQASQTGQAGQAQAGGPQLSDGSGGQ